MTKQRESDRERVCKSERARSRQKIGISTLFLPLKPFLCPNTCNTFHYIFVKSPCQFKKSIYLAICFQGAWTEICICVVTYAEMIRSRVNMSEARSTFRQLTVTLKALFCLTITPSFSYLLQSLSTFYKSHVIKHGGFFGPNVVAFSVQN